MKTIKRMILLEATFQKIPSYIGKLDSDMVKVSGCTWLINQLKGGK